jgi:hypothetical protein
MRTPNSDVAVRDVAQEVIGALLDARDFLGYQLSHANGCMSEVDLNEIADRFSGAEAPTSRSRWGRKHRSLDVTGEYAMV